MHLRESGIDTLPRVLATSKAQDAPAFFAAHSDTDPMTAAVLPAFPGFASSGTGS